MTTDAGKRPASLFYAVAMLLGAILLPLLYALSLPLVTRLRDHFCTGGSYDSVTNAMQIFYGPLFWLIVHNQAFGEFYCRYLELCGVML